MTRKQTPSRPRGHRTALSWPAGPVARAMSRAWAIGSALALVMALAAPAAAQRRSGQPQVIELEELVIEGKVSKPQVFYVLGRTSLRYEGVKLERSFVERIVESARSNPF